MEKSTRIDCSYNGKSQLQVEADSPVQNGIKEESSLGRTHWDSHPVPALSDSDWKSEVGRKSHVDFVNWSANVIGLAVDENFAKSIMSKSVSLVTNSLDDTLTSKSGLMLDGNSLPGFPVKNDNGFSVEITEIVSETASDVDTLPCSGEKTDIDRDDKDDVSIRPLKTESEIEERLSNDSCGSSANIESSEDSRLFENRPIGKLDDLRDSDIRIDGCLLDLKALSCDIDRSGVVDAKKSQKSKTPDSLRPLARLLHDIGLELVRQLVYKDLIVIQEAKEVQKTLEDGDRTQLVKLTEAHSKLCTKSEAHRMPVRSCRCGFTCSSANVMALHQEFGQSSDQFPHICCCCEDFKSKWPSQFVAHMETAHDSKARIQKKLAPYVCFFCAYEHKNWMKIELHMSKCANKFSLSSNLQPQPADCDIPVLYKPGQQAQRIYPMNPPPVPSLPGRFPAPAAPPAPAATPSNQVMPPTNVSPGQSSVMEIDGQLYSLVNHNGKVLLTSLRSQIGSSSSSSGSAVIPSTSGSGKTPFPAQTSGKAPFSAPASGKVPFPPPATGKVPFSTPVARPPKPALEPIKTAVPIHRETCEICGTVVTSREALWTHFRDVHRVELSRTSMREQEPWMKCTFCTTRFWTYQGLARHSSTHHNRNIAPLPQAMSPSRSTRCYLCGHSQTSNPLNHFSTFHNITLLDMYQSRQCCMCNRRLKQSRAFEEHMIVQHRDIFANSEVLHTVIQALSTAHFLKTEDGILQRPPLMVQQLQQNISVAGTTAGSSSTKTVSGTKGVSTASMVSGTRTVSGGPSGLRTVSGANAVSGMRTVAGSSAGSSMRMGSCTAGFVPGTKSFSHANMYSGMKMVSGGVIGAKNFSATRNVSVVGSSPYMRSPVGCARAMTSSTMQGTAKTAFRPPDFKRPKAKPFEQLPPSSSANKTAVKNMREDEQKDASKLYTKLSDLGRPILRSMRHKLSHHDDNFKRSSDLSEQSSVVEPNCSAEREADRCEADGPAPKKPRLDCPDRIQECPGRVDVPGTAVTLSGSGRSSELVSNIVDYLPSGKDL